MHVQYISTSLIDIPETYEREENRVRDSLLRNSIRSSGIQQPLIVLPDGKRFSVAKGTRRLRLARELGIAKVPCVVVKIPKDQDITVYRDRLRFIVDEFRQDLLPSQKADLIDKLKEMFQMTHREVAEYIGIVPDSVRNWLSVKHYIPEVVEAMDAGKLTMQAARVFDGMSEKGQKLLWKKHLDDILAQPGASVHKTFRKQYPPDKHPDMYRDAELSAQRLSRPNGKRTGASKAKSTLSANEKKKMLLSYEYKEAELREGKEELEQLKAQISAAIAPIAAILRSEKLKSHLPKEMGPELERFAEIYV